MAGQDRIVVFGGHGKVALLAAPKFAAAGYAVDSVIRNPDHSADVAQAGAHPTVLDIESADADELAQLIGGARAVVFAAGAGGGDPARTNAVDFAAAVRAMTAAEQARVKRFVLVSYSRAGVDVDRLDPSDPFYPYAKAKHDADAHLRGTNLDYTILGPGMLTLEPATAKIRLVDDAGRIDGRGPEGSESDTSRDNVAEVIVHVIDRDAAVRRTVNFFDGDTPIAEAIV